MGLKTLSYISGGLSIVLAKGLYITNIVFSFKYKIYEFEKESIILTVNNHLNTKLIYSFNARDKCEDGYETLNLGIWNGSYTKPAKNYTVFAGKEICVIRKGTQNCKENYKSCGIIDTLDRKLCVNKDEDCPINKDDIDNFHENLFISNKKLDSENKMYLNEEGDEKKIISLIKLSDGLPCIRNNEFYWSSYHVDENIKFQDCSYVKDKNRDDRYVKLKNFQTNKTELYKDNKLDDYITNKTLKDNTTIYLYGGPLIGINLEKRDFNYENLLSIQKLVNSCSNVMRIFSYILIGSIIFPIIGGGGKAKGVEDACIICNLILGAIFVGISFVVDFILCIIIYEMLKEVVEKYSTNYKFALGLIIVLSLMVFFIILTIICHKYS